MYNVIKHRGNQMKSNLTLIGMPGAAGEGIPWGIWALVGLFTDASYQVLPT